MSFNMVSKQVHQEYSILECSVGSHDSHVLIEQRLNRVVGVYRI